MVWAYRFLAAAGRFLECFVLVVAAFTLATLGWWAVFTVFGRWARAAVGMAP